MTWLTTWLLPKPANDVPQYAAHATEKAAEDHAVELVKSKRACVATVYEAVLPDEEQP